jgi:hypothetical protein
VKDGGKTARKFGAVAAGGGHPDTPVEPARAAKKRFTGPELRVFTAAMAIPDTFPGAAYFRAAGFGTYLAVFQMTTEELARAEKAVGSEIVGQIAALQARSRAAGAGRGGDTGTGRAP